jgi:DoxX-like family/Uncharacterized conserved protein (COG2071)
MTTNGRDDVLGRAGNIATWCVVSVWLVHGLYNKLLHGSPRHLAIVQSVPGLAGPTGQRVLVLIGLFEVAMALWVLSGWRGRLCAATQTVALLSMNVFELSFARDKLLWPAGLIPLNLAFLALAWMSAERRSSSSLFVRLRRHPIAIQAHLESCLTLTYAIPARVLRRWLPPGLELETVGEHGFIAVALVRARSLRPVPLPASLGQDFFLAGYRVFTIFRPPEGRAMRGLRIVRSDADRGHMVAAGNLLTHYHYHRCDAVVEASRDRFRVVVRTADHRGDLDVTADLTTAVLPPGSPLASVREARRFAGPLPFTFDYERETDSIIAVNSRRSNWKPTPVAIDVRRMGFFDDPVFEGCTPVLAAAFHLSNVPYRWSRGVRYAIDRGEREEGA